MPFTMPPAVMSQPPRRPIPLLGEIHLGDRAARALTAEWARHPGPKHGLLIAVTAESAVLASALDALRPGDMLTLVPLVAAGDELRRHVQALGGWIRQRVRIVDAPADRPLADVIPADTAPGDGLPGDGLPADVPPADVIVIAEPLAGDAATTRAYLAEVGKHLAGGGVLAVAALAVPCPAARELRRQAAAHGVGDDLVVRNVPPVRVHRLRYSPAPVELAGRLAAAYRPSSVPLTARMNIDSNGLAAAGIVLGLAAGVGVVARATRRGHGARWLLPALAAVPVAAFFRDPRRDQPDDPRAVLAASDGTVLSVERLTDPRLGEGEFLRIAVFLSVLDVHINRSPVAGRVVRHFVEDGGYAPAMKPAAEHNVAGYTVLETAYGQVAVAQRTGLIARRIVQRAPVGSVLARGERFGLIRFGSRTDVYLPGTAAEPLVTPGDKVAGGASVIARWLPETQ